jgi:hypothetical protein
VAVSKLDELEALAKSSYSQSWVSIDIVDLLNLIDIARQAEKLVGRYEEANANWLRFHVKYEDELRDALGNLEREQDMGGI